MLLRMTSVELANKVELNSGLHQGAHREDGGSLRKGGRLSGRTNRGKITVCPGPSRREEFVYE